MGGLGDAGGLREAGSLGGMPAALGRPATWGRPAVGWRSAQTAQRLERFRRVALAVAMGVSSPAAPGGRCGPGLETAPTDPSPSRVTYCYYC